MTDSRNSREQYPDGAIYQLIDYLGVYYSLSILSGIEELLASQNRNDENAFDVLLRQLVDQKVLTNDNLLQIQKEQSDVTIAGSEKTQKIGNSFGILLLAPERTPTTHDPPEFGCLSPTFKKFPKEFSFRNSPKLGIQDLQTLDIEKTDSNSQGDIAKSPNNKMMIPLFLKDKEFRNMSVLSIETSEMALSQYSLKSEAMIDSYSDDGGEYTIALNEDLEARPEEDSKDNKRNTLMKLQADLRLQKSSLMESNGERSPRASNRMRTSNASNSRRGKLQASIKRKNS